MERLVLCVPSRDDGSVLIRFEDYKSPFRAVSSYRPSGRSFLDWRGVLAFIVLALLFTRPISYI
jgi:hypothetical protein